MPESKPIMYGRGGAGNVTSKPISPALKPQTTPTLKSSVYTTGRGGTGNMAKNDNPEEARRAQDVDVPGVMLPEGSHHIGRGGEGNLYKLTEEQQRQVRAHNEKVRTDSFHRDSSHDRSKIRALADKAKDTAKDVLPGNKQADKK
ncbi:hypothetical protein LTR98_002068 [Exophiala xenobiotica]|nr:hypothetical protein LTR98_002068 [Exophiala xenobiotica]